MPESLSDDIVADLQAVALAATGSPKVSITAMLEAVAKRFDAFGCGLWERTPFSVGKSHALITVAAWWKNGETFAMDDVPINGSPTAKSIKKKKALRVDDIQNPKQGGKKYNEQFWIDNDVHPMCVAPFTFLDRSAGAVNIYRQGRRSFTPDEQARLSYVATLLPGFYRAAREKIELNLVKEIGGLLQHQKTAASTSNGMLWSDEKEPQPQSLSREEVKDILRKVCKAVAKAFGCVEVSMFFGEPDFPSRFSLWATSNRACVRQKVYDLANQNERSSLTKHVLKTWSPITVPDMIKIHEYRDWLAKAYKFEEIAPASYYTDHAQKVLHKSVTHRLPPLTFAALPIFGSADWYFNELCGVLRCYGAKSAPYYFEERDVDVLTVVAQLVGKWWTAWRAHVDLESENATWKRLAKELDRMNLRTLQVLSDSTLVENGDNAREALLREGLRVAESVLQGAKLNGYRLITERNDDLRFSIFNETAERLLEAKEAITTYPDDFPTKDKSKWAWKVYESGHTMILRDLYNPSSRAVREGYVPIFSDTTAILIAPVGVGTSRKGVLDLRWTGTSMPKYAGPAATLIGQQVGICLQLLDAVIDLQREKAASLRDQLLQQRIYDDFSHQMKSPITQARRRLEEAVRWYGSQVAPRPLLVARGLVRRVHRVAQSMRMLRSVSKGEQLSIAPHSIDKSILIKSLQEIGTDAAHQYANGVSFEIDDVSIHRLNLGSYNFDIETVEQCLANLMDNAVKYSRSNSVANVWGGIDLMNRFYIAVANFGIPIAQSELYRVGERGWRSYAARASTPDGQGIGLWLVKELLQRQNAELFVEPRNMIGMTEFRIVFNKLLTPQKNEILITRR